jgi:uncharacterized protein (TIRG00374 family)
MPAQGNLGESQTGKPLRTGRWLIGLWIGIGISAVALIWVLRWAGWRPFLDALGRVQIGWLALGVALFLVSMVARGLCWRMLIGRPVGLVRVLAALNEGYLLNNLLPWRLGELGRAILLGRRPGLSPALVLSSIVIERFFDILLAVGLMAALLPAVAVSAWAGRATVLGAIVILVGLAVLLLALRRPDLVDRVVTALPGGSRLWLGQWNAFRDGLKVVETPRRLVLAFAWMLVSWVLAWLEYWAVLSSIVPDARLLWAAFLLAATLLGVAVPSSPGYIGVFEAAGVAALSAFGIPPGQGLAASLVLHGMVFSIASGLGAVALAGDGESIAGIFGQVRGWMTARQAS